MGMPGPRSDRIVREGVLEKGNRAGALLMSRREGSATDCPLVPLRRNAMSVWTINWASDRVSSAGEIGSLRL
jgi:hypothetical protein